MGYLVLEEVRRVSSEEQRKFLCSLCLETYTTPNLRDTYPEDVLTRFHAHCCAMRGQEHAGPQALYWGVACKQCPFSSVIVLKQIESRAELGRACIPLEFSAACDLCRQTKSYEKNDVRIVRANLALPPFEPHKAFATTVTS